MATLQKDSEPSAAKMHCQGFPFKLVVLHLGRAEGPAGNVDRPVTSIVIQLGQSGVYSNWRGIREEGSLLLGVEVGEKGVVADCFSDGVE